MLVITRRIGETFLMETDNGTIEVMVLGVNGSQVRVGISADESVRVLRSELIEQEVRDERVG